MIGFVALVALATSTNSVAQELIVHVPELSSAAAQQLVEACVAIAAEADAQISALGR